MAKKKKTKWDGFTIELHDRPLKRENWMIRLQRRLGLRGKFR